MAFKDIDKTEIYSSIIRGFLIAGFVHIIHGRLDFSIAAFIIATLFFSLDAVTEAV